MAWSAGRRDGLFQWPYSSVIIPFLFPLGFAFIALGTSDLVPIQFFDLAYIVFIISALSALGFALTHPTLKQLNPHFWHGAKRRRSNSRTGRVIYLIARWVLASVILIALAVSIRIAYVTKYNREMSSIDGVLEPADLPTPDTCPSHPLSKYVVYFPESNVAVMADRLPLPILRSATSQKVVAQIEELPNGNIGLDVDIKSGDDKVIVRVIRNQFLVNHNNYLSFSRQNDKHDKSTLSVTGQNGDEVLKLKYLNDYTFEMTANVRIDGRQLNTAKLNVKNVCFVILHGPEGAGAIEF